jgi:hypothetical protein
MTDSAPNASSIALDAGARLAREWARIRTRPAVLRQAERWQLVDGPLGDLDDVLAAVGFEVPGSARTEANLRRLVLVAADDELAGRVVVQRLLPGLFAVAARRQGRSTFDELLGVAWIVIRTFNPARSPRCLAAALLSDVEYRAFRCPERRRRFDETPVEWEHALVDRRDPSPSDEIAELFRFARESGVDDADIELLHRLLTLPTAIDVARALQVTPRTIRNRRRRITSRLRELALAA